MLSNCRILFFYVLVIISNHFAWCQNSIYTSKDYKIKTKGFIISQTGDTLTGSIRLKGKLRNQRKLSFIDSNNRQIVYRPDDIKAYKCGDLNYISVSDKYTKNKPVFLHQLAGGYLKYYNFYDIKLRRLFKSIPLPIPEMISIPLVQKNNDRLHHVFIWSFRDELSVILKDYPELSAKIYRQEYKFRDLPVIVKEYNDWHEKNNK